MHGNTNHIDLPQFHARVSDFVDFLVAKVIEQIRMVGFRHLEIAHMISVFQQEW